MFINNTDTQLMPNRSKRFISLIIFALLLVACRPPPRAETPPIHFVSTSVNVTMQENRYIITLWSGGDYYAAVERVQVAARDPNQSAHPISWQGEAVGYTDYAVPYWVVFPEFTAPGIWRLEINARLENGAEVVGTLLANVTATAPSVVSGMPAPPSDTLTLDDGLPLLMMTTDPTPNPAYYRLSVADAVSSGKPSLIIFATPGLCTSKICTPVMDFTIDGLWARYGEALNFVHVEIYDLQTSEYVAAMDEWGLNYEPWTYLVDADGVVVQRYDGPLAFSEITPHIEALLG